MRQWHRRLMTVFGILLLYWAVSGLVMAIYDATDHNQIWAVEGGGPGARLTDDAKYNAAIPDPATVKSGVAKVLAANRGKPIASVDLRFVGRNLRLQVAEASGDRAERWRYYADSGLVMDDDTADATLSDPPNHQFRNWLKAWHRGNIVGLPGQFVGLFTGLALIGIVVTGVFFYVQLWRSRAALGRRGFFWSGRETIWRRLHRWSAIVSAVFLLNMSISGVILAWGEIQLDIFLQYHMLINLYPRPTPLPAQSSGTLPGNVQTMLENGYHAALAQNPAAKVTSVTLEERGDGVPHALVVLGGAQPQTLAFNALTAVPVADWATSGVQHGQGYYADWHQMLKRFHRGDIVGNFSGRFIEIGAGICLLYLVISSFFMYRDLLLPRWVKGKKSLLW